MSELDYTYKERQRDVNAGLYEPFFIADDAVFAIDGTTVSIQLTDPAGNPLKQVLGVLVSVCGGDVDDGVFTVTRGSIFEDSAPNYTILTDEAGRIEGDVTGTPPQRICVILPTGAVAISPDII